MFQAVVNQDEIHRMARSEDVEKRKRAAEQLRKNFADLPDKKQAWEDLHSLTQDRDDNLRRGATGLLGAAFPHIPEKHREQAWSDLLSLMQDKDDGVRRGAACSLGAAFPHIPKKCREQVWSDLHNLTRYKKAYVRMRAAGWLGATFSYIPEKYREQAWSDLHSLTQDRDDNLRMGAARSLCVALPYIPERHREQAWSDLHSLTLDKNGQVRRGAVISLGATFPYIPEKHREQVWSDLHSLTQDRDDIVRRGAAGSLGAAFPYIPEKHRDQAWSDLHSLTQDEHGVVRSNSAGSLGAAFPHIPEKYRDQAWSDLHSLTMDHNRRVLITTNHSLGRASIFKATNAETEEDFRKEVENSLKYFERSSRMATFYSHAKATFYNPARFCLPFYRSFYTIAFRKQEAENEVKKYIEEAKSAVEGSESKEKLLEAVKNLGNALKEAQKARDLNDLKSDLNTYWRYLDRACELLDTTEEKAPGATMLIRKGLPIIDERIKGIIAEIQEKAKALCKQVKDTEYKEIGQQVNNVGQELLKVIDPIRLDKEVSRMLIPLSAMCKKMPEEDRGEACELLKQINDEQNVEDKLPLISMFLSKISTQMNPKKEPNMEKIENKQIIIGNGNIIGDGNKQDQSSNSSLEKNSKKSWKEILNSSATVAAFIGFLAVEIGTYFYPLSYNHLISVIVAAISFMIVAILNRR